MTEGPFRIVPCGDDALRILCGPGRIRYQLARHLSEFSIWPEIVPGKEDVTVLVDVHSQSLDRAAETLRVQLSALPAGDTLSGSSHVLPVIFGGLQGPDLEQVAEFNGISVEMLIEAVAQAELEVDMIGFTPGFSYLAGLAPSVQAERLALPRVRVPAGSVGVLTGQVGLYALDGPGGWPIIGRVTVSLFNSHADKPFRLMPGDRVRLVPEARR